MGRLTAAPIILFGRDERHRPHASRFEAAETTGAEAAARLIGMHLALAEDETLWEIAAKLPHGRLFERTGRAFVPFVAADLYSRIVAATGTPDEPKPARHCRPRPLRRRPTRA